jgi:hypothetical protein
MVITGSKFEGNTASFGNNIYGSPFGDLTCDDGTNTFESPDVVNLGNDSQGNYPADICARACDVRTFNQLQEAIVVGGDIKLCSETIVFTKKIDLIDKQLTFTCPNGGCVLDAQENFRIFRIRGGSNISFDGITFKNGKASVSPQ